MNDKQLYYKIFPKGCWHKYTRLKTPTGIKFMCFCGHRVNSIADCKPNPDHLTLVEMLRAREEENDRSRTV